MIKSQRHKDLIAHRQLVLANVIGELAQGQVTPAYVTERAKKLKVALGK